MNQPQEVHLMVAKYILKYLKETMDHGILFQDDDEGELQTYVGCRYCLRDTF